MMLTYYFWFFIDNNTSDPAPNHPQSVEAAIAAQDFIKVQEVAAAFDPPLKIVSPAPSSADFDENGKSKWLDYFFGNCTQLASCKPELIEVIAFHDYIGDPQKMKQRIDGMYQHYGQRKLWLTEYSIGRWNPGWPSREEHNAYMKATLPLLESHPAIERYVWFNSRAGSSRWLGHSDMIETYSQDSVITSTGEIYKTWPEGAANQSPGDGTGIIDSPTDSPSYFHVTYEGEIDCACRERPNNPSDKGIEGYDYILHDPMSTLQGCQDLCTARFDCTGVEYNPSSLRCEVWLTNIGFMVEQDGNSCYRKITATSSQKPITSPPTSPPKTNAPTLKPLPPAVVKIITQYDGVPSQTSWNIRDMTDKTSKGKTQLYAA